MIDVSYIRQPDPKSCALASYTMVARHFFPEVNFKQIAKISDWHKGYVVWAFKFWLWIMDKGVLVKEYDTLDYESWAKEGVEGLKKSVSENEYNFYIKNTWDINSYTTDINKVLEHPNFTLVNEKPTFEALEKAVKDNKICEVVLDSRTLKDLKGFSLHRVIVLKISNDEVFFHDPDYAPNTKVSIEKFTKSWLKAVSEPELCIYERK